MMRLAASYSNQIKAMACQKLITHALRVISLKIFHDNYEIIMQYFMISSYLIDIKN